MTRSPIALTKIRALIGVAALLFLAGCHQPGTYYPPPTFASAQCMSSCDNSRNYCRRPPDSTFGCESAHARCVAACQRYSSQISTD